MKQDAPALASYLQLDQYIPQYGDFVIWSGWITTWVGVVCDYNNKMDEITIIFSGVPFVLFTLTDSEQIKEMRRFKLDKIKSSSKGVWAINRHDSQKNSSIWFI